MTNTLDVFMSEVLGKNLVVDRRDLFASFDQYNALMGEDLLDRLEERYAIAS